jgi:carboxyl-terminal processing protease
MDNPADQQKKFNPYTPIWISLILVAGVFLGTFFNFRRNSVVANTTVHNGQGKIDNVIDFITQNYVDKIDADSLQDMTLLAMLHSLDPHSDYIPAQDLELVNEPLQGNFEGIGVEFNILNDTITVVTPVSGGPSEKVGVMAGDKLIKVNGVNVAGVKITNKQVFDKLRGKGGTKVKITVKRNGSKQLLDFTITRGEIPIYSVDVSYMVTNDIGYIKINRFAATTYEEYLKAFNSLKKQGMKKMIVDLRGNGGGFLNAAVDIADEFLKKGMRIVYTEGKASPRKDYKATDRGGYENDPLVILIDEGSASASEILAGSVQDNDRATIVGRRSFGKGLVQEQMEMPDGSAIRLTTARYYTPTGRCIQKSYANGNEAYAEEELHRYENGELLTADSIKFADSLKYRTPAGKIVYGGGGIMPDVFVGLDTTFRSSWLNKVAYTGLINEFAFQEVDKDRSKFKNYKSATDFAKNYELSADVFNRFVAYAEKNGIKKDEAGIKRSSGYLRTQLKALMGRNLFGNDAYYPVSSKNDRMLEKAIQALNIQHSNLTN